MSNVAHRKPSQSSDEISAKYGSKPSKQSSAFPFKQGVSSLVGFVLGALLVYCLKTESLGPEQQQFSTAGRKILTSEAGDCSQTLPAADHGQEPCHYTVNDTIAKLRDIFDEQSTDKGYTHAYYRTYGRHLYPYRYLPVRMMEIGVAGGRSIEAWEKFFPNYEHIYGVGYGLGFKQKQQKQDLDGKSVTLYQGDQSDLEFLEYIVSDMGEQLDIIIDDGSHVPDHQQISLENLIDFLKPGGLYIVEDVFTSYYNKPGADVYGYILNGTGLYQPGSFVERIKKVVDVVNREEHLQLDMTFLKNDHQIASIAFEQDCIVFRKVDSWDTPFTDRRTKFAVKGVQV